MQKSVTESSLQIAQELLEREKNKGGGERELRRMMEDIEDLKRVSELVQEDKERLQRRCDGLMKEVEERKKRENEYEQRLQERNDTFEKEKLALKNDLITLLKDGERCMQEDEQEIKRLRDELTLMKRREEVRNKSVNPFEEENVMLKNDLLKCMEELDLIKRVHNRDDEVERLRDELLRSKDASSCCSSSFFFFFSV